MSIRDTKLTDEVMLGGCPTTILDAFRGQRTHAFRVYTGNGNGSPSDRHFVTIWGENIKPETFDVSKEDYEYLRGSGRQA